MALNWFKYLRVTTAFLLMLIAVSSFGFDSYVQSKSLLDGPFAWPFQYTFSLNKIAYSTALSVVLFFDFNISLPKWGPLFLKIVGMSCSILSVVGLIYLIKQNLLGRWDSAFIWFYSNQVALFLVSIIIFIKGFEEKSDA